MTALTLQKAWQQRSGLALLLLPLACVFAVLSALRRGLYRFGLFQAIRLPVPVVIVGNITVGGVGKTPLTVHLVEQLRAAGRKPGVISRGYGRETVDVRAVSAASVASEVGDEPLLIARRTGAPVVVGRDRVAAAQALLAAYPEVDVLISDDGLQHYRLARDVEIAVFDARGAMNGWLLPAGPLREPVSRLATVDAVVCNIAVSPALTLGNPAAAFTHGPTPIRMQLVMTDAYRLDDPAQKKSLTQWVAERGDDTVHALAGIGHPERFFAQLRSLGLTLQTHPFPDHHRYSASDLPQDARAILVTEKDAVKLSHLAPADRANSGLIWVVPVQCRLEPDALLARILEKISGSPPA
jgi:tetraacyldisaccharide 4'-kinase